MDKIFISHSSKDRDLITRFVDDILVLGLGFTSDEIIYTSEEDTGVSPNENIVDFIKQNIQQAHLILLMFSIDYNNSKVCTMEMGAAQFGSVDYIPVLLPNHDATCLPWPIEQNKAILIAEEDKIDSLIDCIANKFSKTITLARINRAKAKFCEYIKSRVAGESPVKHVQEYLDVYLSHDVLLNTQFGRPTSVAGYTISVRITNCFKETRYVCHPSFECSVPFEKGISTFLMTEPIVQRNYPIKLERGEVLTETYRLFPGTYESFRSMLVADEKATIKAIVSSTLKEIFQSNELIVASLVRDEEK